MTEKSKDQSLLQYFETLQLEYFVCEIRRKIYPKRKDKSHYEQVMRRKQEKIEDIAHKNDLPTIFSCKDTKNVLRRKIYVPNNYPNFIYKNDEDRYELETKDLYNYFSKGAEVKIKVSDNVFELGMITEGLQGEWIFDDMRQVYRFELDEEAGKIVEVCDLSGGLSKQIEVSKLIRLL